MRGEKKKKVAIKHRKYIRNQQQKQSEEILIINEVEITVKKGFK